MKEEILEELPIEEIKDLIYPMLQVSFNSSFSYNGTLYNFRKLFNSCFRPVDHCHGKISFPESRVDQKMYVEQIIFFL